jgi:hypothetical protein
MRSALLSPDRFVLVAALVGAGCNSLAGIAAPIELPTDANDGPDSDSPGSASTASGSGGSGMESDAAEPPVREASADDAVGSVDGTRNDASSDAGFDAASTSIRFRNSSRGSSMTRILEVSRPPLVEPGDFLWLTIYTDHAATKVTPPPGWEWFDSVNMMNDFRSWWFRRFADTYEPPRESFSLSQDTPSWYVYVVYSGVNPEKPLDNFLVVDTHGSPCVAPSIHPMRSSGLLFLTAFVNDEASIWGLTNPLDPLSVRDSTRAVLVADFPQAFVGDTPTKSVSCTPVGDGAVAVVGLIPAGTP